MILLLLVSAHSQRQKQYSTVFPCSPPLPKEYAGIKPSIRQAFRLESGGCCPSVTAMAVVADLHRTFPARIMAISRSDTFFVNIIPPEGGYVNSLFSLFSFARRKIHIYSGLESFLQGRSHLFGKNVGFAINCDKLNLILRELGGVGA